MSIGYFQWTKIGCFRWTRSGCFRRTLTGYYKTLFCPLSNLRTKRPAISVTSDIAGLGLFVVG